MNNHLINILTRTSNRPNYFINCFNNVKNQTYKNINHIISVDNDESEKYVKTQTDNYIKLNIPINPNPPIITGRRYAPYNSYLNDLRNQVKDGWVLYLDDDDIFMSNSSLQKIVNHIDNDDQLLMWRVKFPNRIIPEDEYFNNKKVVLNHFSGIGFMYHSKYDKYSKWEVYSGGDYFFVDNLLKVIPNIKWINEVYTGLQRTDSMGGFGKKDDLKNIKC